MNLPTENPTPFSVGGEDGGVFRGSVAVLDSSIYRDMRWCVGCAGEQVFLEVYEFSGGRVGVCLGCGEEKLIPFTRTNSEAA